jgi:hypothetical protein
VGGDGMKAAHLEVNTSTTSRIGKSGYVWIPRGAKIETFSPEDLTVFKRALRWQRKRAAEVLLPGERVEKCYTIRIKSQVEVLYTPKIKRAHYGGLMICGSVWMCPVCAAKITERRRMYLENATSKEFSTFMVTITLQHGMKDKLKNLMDDLSAAWGKVTSGRGWQDIKQKYQLVGSLTGREVTDGFVFGWHPHLHVLYYSRLPLAQIDTDDIRYLISDRFGLAIAKVGRYAHPLHGVNVIKGDDVMSLYLAKVGLEAEKGNTWNLNSEITKAPAKGGRIVGDNVTPFQHLDLYMCGDVRSGKRFIEYAKTMKGRKQLVPSRGLWELIGVEAEATDQELAEAQDQESRNLSMLSEDNWREVLKHGKRGALLEVASSGDYQLFKNWCKLSGIGDLPEKLP